MNIDRFVYAYDVLGRITSGTASTLGTGVDDATRRLGFTYNDRGLPWQFTSYSDTSGATELNQVTRQYSGLGQLIREYQEQDGEVDGSTPSVQYTYSEMTGGANHSRLSSMVYPDGRELFYSYGTTSGLNDRLSRLEALVDDDGTTSLEAFSYLGLSSVVERAHAETGVDLTYIGTIPGDGGDQYAGIDRFGRIADQNWTDGTTTADRFTYTYDRNSNRLTKTNTLESDYSETYTYESLNRLTDFVRADGRDQVWDLDALGQKGGHPDF